MKLKTREEIITFPDRSDVKILYKQWLFQWYWQIEDPFIASCCNRPASTGPFLCLNDAMIDVCKFFLPFITEATDRRNVRVAIEEVKR